MYSISSKIKLIKPAVVAKKSFINDEIIPSAMVKFTCCDCGHENSVEIKPYESGFPILQVYNENKVLSKEELLQKELVSETSKGLLHFGELTAFNLPTLYFGTDCISCNAKYFGVFSYGEKQPGLTALNISGIWK